MMRVTKRLVFANVGVFVAMILLGINAEALYASRGLIPARFLSGFGLTSTGLGQFGTIFTSMFLHGGFWHLAANMVFLWFFGRLVEERIGSRKFVWLYVLSGVGAAVAQIAIDPTSIIPMIGASGAISGTLGAAMILAPREKIMLLSPFTLFIPITMTITTFGVVWLAMQLFGAIGGEGGIAFMAHLGGFAAGYLLTRRRSEPQREEPSGIRPGEAPSSRFRTVWVTDARGQTFAFHEPA